MEQVGESSSCLGRWFKHLGERFSMKTIGEWETEAKDLISEVHEAGWEGGWSAAIDKAIEDKVR